MSKKPSKSDEAPIDPAMPFEAAQAELEELIERIESGQAGLEEAMTAYERGLALLRHCRGILDQAEGKFTDLTNQMKAGLAGGPGGTGGAGADADEDDE